MTDSPNGRSRKRPWGLVAVLGGLAIGLVGLVWFSMTGDAIPHHQERVTAPGVGEHLVNLWTDPNPPGSGAVDLTAQVTDVAGFPIVPNDLTFVLVSERDIPPVEAQGVYDRSGPGRGQVFRATSDFDAEGMWDVLVQYRMGAVEAEAVFRVEVRN